MTKQQRHARWLALLAALYAREAVRHAARLAAIRHARHLRRLKMFGPTYGQPTTPSYDDEVLADSPLSYWKLDELGGSVAVDSVGSTDGTYVGTPTFGLPGVAGGTAVQMYGPSGASCLEIVSETFNFVGRLPFAFEIWVKPVAGAAGWSAAGYQPNPFNAEWAFATFLYPLDAPGFDTDFWRANDDEQIETDTHLISKTDFSHMVGQYDGNAISLYINGVLHGPVADTHSMSATPNSTLYVPGGVGADQGVIACRVAIYDHALSPERVAAHYAAGIAA